MKRLQDKQKLTAVLIVFLILAFALYKCTRNDAVTSRKIDKSKSQPTAIATVQNQKTQQVEKQNLPIVIGQASQDTTSDSPKCDRLEIEASTCRNELLVLANKVGEIEALVEGLIKINEERAKNWTNQSKLSETILTVENKNVATLENKLRALISEHKTYVTAIKNSIATDCPCIK